MKLIIRECPAETGGWAVVDEANYPLFSGTQYECAEFVLQQTGGKPEDCPAADVWNCKYCGLVEKCKLHSHGEAKAYSELRLDHAMDVDSTIVSLVQRHGGRSLVFPIATPLIPKIHKAVADFRAACPAIADYWGNMLQKDISTSVKWPVVLEDPHAVTWGDKSREEILADIDFAIDVVHAHTPPRVASLAKEVAENIAKDAQRYGVVKSTTDWDTAEGAIRLRFFDYASCQIAVRMHNGVLTHLYVNGNCCYDAH